MRICERCGKEHDGQYGSGRFCSIKCSHSREHNELTKDKISKTLKSKITKKKKFCKSCNERIYKRGKFCDNCFEYIKNIKLFEKLKISNKNLLEAANEAEDKLIKLYYHDDKSLCEIRSEYNIQFNTVYFFLKKRGINLRSSSEAVKLSYKLGKGFRSGNYNFNCDWHRTWYGKEVYLRSSYEKRFAERLDLNQIYYEVEKKRISYEHEEEEHIYIADFFIPKLNLIVETKNKFLFNRDREKIKSIVKKVKSLNYNMVVLLDEEEIDKFEL